MVVKKLGSNFYRQTKAFVLGMFWCLFAIAIYKYGLKGGMITNDNVINNPAYSIGSIIVAIAGFVFALNAFLGIFRNKIIFYDNKMDVCIGFKRYTIQRNQISHIKTTKIKNISNVFAANEFIYEIYTPTKTYEIKSSHIRGLAGVLPKYVNGEL